MGHLVTLSVGTDTPEQHKAVHSLLSEIGGDMPLDYHYVSVTSVDTDRPTDGDDLFQDASTANKAREAIKAALETRVSTAPESLVDEILRELRAARIEFWERREN